MRLVDPSRTSLPSTMKILQCVILSGVSSFASTPNFFVRNSTLLGLNGILSSTIPRTRTPRLTAARNASWIFPTVAGV